MKSGHLSTCACILTMSFTTLAPRLAHADGGIVQLRQTQGPFWVTVFLSPELADGDADVSVMVQRSKNCEIVLDANVDLTAKPPTVVSSNDSDPLCGLSATAVASRVAPASDAVRVHATREQASNKLLYAALLRLRTAGDWRLHVLVSQGSDHASFNCALPVDRTSAGLQPLWPYLLFPPIVIIAFAINQYLRKSSLETSFPAGSIPNLASTGKSLNPLNSAPEEATKNPLPGQ